MFFSVYRMEGVSPENPDEDIIYFEVNSSYIVSAIGNIKNQGNLIEIKLGKVEYPFFTINTQIQSAVDPEKTLDVSNQVPVIIVPRIGWNDFEPPYGKFDCDLDGSCPRFCIFKRFVDTFKYAQNIEITLRRNDRTLTIEANEDSTRHFNIFKNIKVSDYDSENPCNYSKVSAIVEQKQISFWLHSVLFLPSSVKIECKIKHKKHLKLFYRLADVIMSTFIIATEFDEQNDISDTEDPESGQE